MAFTCFRRRFSRSPPSSAFKTLPFPSEPRPFFLLSSSLHPFLQTRQSRTPVQIAPPAKATARSTSRELVTSIVVCSLHFSCLHRLTLIGLVQFCKDRDGTMEDLEVRSNGKMVKETRQWASFSVQYREATADEVSPMATTILLHASNLSRQTHFGPRY